MKFLKSISPALLLVPFCFVLLTACTSVRIIQSSTKNPPGNETMVDRINHIVVSASNDNNGILVNVRVPSPYDQYKILKYGAHLYVNLNGQSRSQYAVTYPLPNYDKNLRLPVVPGNDGSFQIDSLLNSLTQEASVMDLKHFYGRNLMNVSANQKDSVSAEVSRENSSIDKAGALVYSVYIPYNAFSYLRYQADKIRIGFVTGSLNIPGSAYGSPGFGAGYVGGYMSHMRHGLHGGASPDPRVVQKLATPINFWVDIRLSTLAI